MESTIELPDAKWRAKFRRQLLRWFEKNARDLPWRDVDDPYAVWVSEIMLQQTQIATVRAYYARFLKSFPTVKRLASAPEEKVLRLWEGLGYYRRARQMHKAAQQIVAEHGGKFPATFDEVFALPGIGRYTAGAVLSLALDQRLPIVEANTIRLYSRLLGYRDDPTTTVGQRLLWSFAESVLPKKNTRQLNSAMMDLGSMVCTPRNPDCAACPLSGLCAARLNGQVDEIPKPKKPKQYTEVTEAAVVVRAKGRVLVRQCAVGERWAGLWDFPRTAVQSRDPSKLTRELTSAVKEQTGVAIRLGDKLATMKHAVTRYRITLHCFEAQAANSSQRSSKSLKWLSVNQLEDLPLSTTGRKISRLLD